MKTISKIIKFITQRNTIKIVSVILILGMFWVLPTYAADAKNDFTTMQGIQDFLSMLIGLLNRVWIFLAFIAGKLMTNDMVYGSFMHMDIYLWKIWNIMKNFANFGLAFMIIFGIVKSVINKDKADNPKQIVVKALMAGILIQASWFLAGALIDVSTIATSAIASFPANFIGSTKLQVAMVAENGKTKTKFVAKEENGKLTWDRQPLDDANSCDINTDIDNFMPKYDSVSGPLVFIGMSALKSQSYMDAESIKLAKPGTLIINFLLKVLILGFYTVCLLLLCIANIVRIVFLRLLILAAPIVVLLAIFDPKGEGMGGVTKYLNFKTFVDLIFKPLFFVGFLSLTLIIITSMQQIMTGHKIVDNINGVTMSFTGNKSNIAVPGVASVEIQENIFKDIGGEAKNLFADLIIMFLTLFLLWNLLKRSITSTEGPISDVMKPIASLIQKYAANIPIVPTAAGGMGVESLLSARKQATKKAWESIGGKGAELGKFQTYETAFKRKVDAMLGLPQARAPEDYEELRQIIRNDDKGNLFFDEFVKKGKNYQGGISLSNPDQYKVLEEWFTRNNTVDKLQALGFQGATRFYSLDEFLGKDETYETDEKKKNRARLHELLGGNEKGALMGTLKTKPSYKDLMGYSYWARGNKPI